MEAAGPPDVDLVGPPALAQTKMGTEVALGKVTTTSRHFAHLGQLPCSYFDPRSHGIAVATATHQLEADKVIVRGAIVVEQQRRVAVIAHHHLQSPVIVEISEGDPAAGIRFGEAVTRNLAHLGEFAVSLVVKQRIDLLVVNFGRLLLNLGINVPVGDKKVQPAIVIVIKESPAEAQDYFSRFSHSRDGTDFVEETLAIVVPDVVPDRLEIRDVQAKIAVIVVVAQRHAHGCHLVAVAGEPGAARHSHFGERAVMIVVVEISCQAIVGDKEVRPAVVVVVARLDREVDAFGLVNLRRLGDVGKGPVPVVVIQNVGATPVDGGSATAQHAS